MYTVKSHLNELNKKGFTRIDNVFSGEFLDKLKKKNLKRWKAFKKSSIYSTIIKRAKFRGSTVMFLVDGRYDLALDFGVFQSNKFIENKKIMKVVDSLFKTGFTYFAGSIPAASGSSDGLWHRDTWPLFDDEKLEGSLPVHYITVLIPLVDISDENGPTEIIVGSHRGVNTGKKLSVCGKAGSAIILDGRILHRGLANLSDNTRHMLYIVYCKKWYLEYPDEIISPLS
jgi:ectoine hydroxylase-related dioxygenase (phytanoyl-CoA dioxygenase family)